MNRLLRLLVAACLFLAGAIMALAQLLIYRDLGAAVATLGGTCLVASIVSPFTD